MVEIRNILSAINPTTAIPRIRERQKLVELRDREMMVLAYLQDGGTAPYLGWFGDDVVEEANHVAREMGRRGADCHIFGQNTLSTLREENCAGSRDYPERLSRTYSFTITKALTKNGPDNSPTAFNSGEVRRLAAISYLQGALDT